MELPTLHGARLLLRPAAADDVAALVEILDDPEVVEWWGRYPEDKVRDELPETFAIVVDDAVAGWLHVTEEADPDYPSVAFDIVVSARVRGQGYGGEAMRVAIRHYVARGHHRFTIDPAVDNERAIRSYAALGFQPVGVLRSCERAPAGGWRDGLLMDLLADELIDG